MPAKCEIRDARPSDARALNAYIRAIYADSDHLITKPGEFRMGVLRQRFWIARKSTNRFETCLLALDGQKIVGMLDSWTDRRARVRHTTTFAMSVDKGHRGAGIGRQLLTRFIDWVRAHDTLKRIELHVHSDNTAAIALYRSAGFVMEGTRAQAVEYEDGRIVDDHIMSLWPKRAPSAKVISARG